MNKKLLFILWGIAYALCAVLGFFPNPEGAVRVLMILLAVCSFVPPLVLVYTGDLHTKRLIRCLSAIWLVLTLALIVANVVSAPGSIVVGNILYSLLVIISSPMVCGQYWVLSLFGWAYLMYASIFAGKK